jgi:delta 1-pyrroline-5-carboxylate dehydrogenase
MKKTQRKEFSQRLTEIFKEDAEVLLEKFVEGFGKKNFLKNKIKEIKRALNFCRMFKPPNLTNEEDESDRLENLWRR